MLDTVTSAPARRVRRAGSLAAVLLAVVCSLSLVIGVQPPASAFTNPGPVTIGTALRAAPLAGPATVTCAASVVCGGLVLAGGIGYTLYQTRDSWMPVVSDALNTWGNMLGIGGSSQGGTCALSVTSATPHNNGDLTAMVSWSQNCSSSGATASPQVTLWVSDVKCVATGLDTAFGVAKGTVYMPKAAGNDNAAQTYQSAGSAPGSAPIVMSAALMGCAVGPQGNRGVMYSAKVRAQVSYWTTRSSTRLVDWIVPEAYWSVDSEVTCRRPDGSTFALNGTEMGDQDRVTFDSCYADDPSSIPVNAEVTGPDGESLINFDSPDWWNDYPNCFGPSGLLCDIFVALDGIKCEVGQALCSDWPHRTENPRLQCRFGEYDVPFDRCEALKRNYRPGSTPTEITDPTGWPQPEPEPDPDPDPPVDPEPSPSPSPTGNPSSPPTSGPNPNPPPVDPEVTNPDSQGCLGETWSWNPVSWVYAPVKCALIWAFVPKTALSIRIDRIKVALGNKAPFSWFGGFGTIPVAIPSGDCPNWVVKVDGKSENVVCGRPYTEAIRAMRPVLLVFMGALALWPLIRSTAYAAFPIIKPQPGMLR